MCNCPLQCQQHALVEVLFRRRSNCFYAGVRTVGLDHVGKIDDFLELCHIGLSRRVPLDGALNRLALAENFPRGCRAGFCVQ